MINIPRHTDDIGISQVGETAAIQLAYEMLYQLIKTDYLSDTTGISR
jgi:hypothetical protein